MQKLIKIGAVEYRKGLVVTKVTEEYEGATLTLQDISTLEQSNERFDVVFVACGPINTTRLMLASRQILDRPVALKESQKFVLPMLRWGDAPGALDEGINTLAAAFYETKFPELSRNWAHVQLTPISDLALRQLRLQSGQALHALRPVLAPVLRRLMLGWVSMHSDHSSEVRLTLRQEMRNGQNVLEIDTAVREQALAAERQVARGLFSQGLMFKSLFTFPVIKHSNPGSGTHCGGSFPMRQESQSEFDTDIFGRPFGWKRVFLVDSSILPSIPATTTAFNVVANALRIATTAPLP